MTVSVPGKYWRLSIGIVIGALLMGIAPPIHAALTVLVGEPFGSYPDLRSTAAASMCRCYG